MLNTKAEILSPLPINGLLRCLVDNLETVSFPYIEAEGMSNNMSYDCA